MYENSIGKGGRSTTVSKSRYSCTEERMSVFHVFPRFSLHLVDDSKTLDIQRTLPWMDSMSVFHVMTVRRCDI